MVDEVIEKTETQVGEELFNEAFDEAGKEASAGSEITPEVQPKKEEVKPLEEKKEGAPIPTPEERIASLEQQLTDTKGWGTKNATEVAELKREIVELKKSAEKSPEEEPVPEDLKSFYDDYPEFKKAVEWEAKRLTKGLVTSQTVTPEIQGVIGQISFDQAVMFGYAGEEGWVEGHPDSARIVHSKEFTDWAGKEKIDPNTVKDPKEAIKIISRFKEAKVKGAFSEHDKEKAKEKKEREEAAAANISSTKGGGGGKGKSDPNDYDGAWDEAAKRN